MRHFLISVLFVSLAAGCSTAKIGPHRIDVQQGNALDQENVARLKPGLSRSQVRFLLGTPLLVDPFRTDRWDYVYLFYKAGKLTEQKRITLFFEGDTLARIEGDVPAASRDPVPQPASVATPAFAAPVATTPASGPAASASTSPASPPAAPAAAPAQSPSPSPLPAETSVVPPLTAPKSESAPSDSPAPRIDSGTGLQSETDVTRVQPDVVPSFRETGAASPAAVSARDAPVLDAVKAWADAWSRRDVTGYLSAYDERFIPQDGMARAEWEKRKHRALETAKDIRVDVQSPTIARSEEGVATVTFKQFYRSDRYRDAVVKQLSLVEQDGRWLIVEEKVLSSLREVQP